MRHLQISSPEAIDAEIAEAEKSLASGAKLFIGGHGGAAKADAVEFKIAYLKTMKEFLSQYKTAAAFVEAMKNPIRIFRENPVSMIWQKHFINNKFELSRLESGIVP